MAAILHSQVGRLQKTKNKLWVSAALSIGWGIVIGQSGVMMAKWGYDHGKNWIQDQIVQNDPVYKQANQWLDEDVKEGWITQDTRPVFEKKAAFSRLEQKWTDKFESMKSVVNLWGNSNKNEKEENEQDVHSQSYKKWLTQYSQETSVHSHVNLILAKYDREDASGFTTDQGEHFKVEAKNMVLHDNNHMFYSFWSGQSQEEYRFVFEHELAHVLKNSHHPWWHMGFHPQGMEPGQQKIMDQWMDVFGHGRFMGLESQGKEGKLKGWNPQVYEKHLEIEKLQGEIVSDSYALARNLERVFKIKDEGQRNEALMQWKANAIHLWGGRFLETTSGGGDKEHWTAQAAWTWLNIVNQPKAIQVMEKASPYQWTRWSQEVGVYSWMVTLQDQAQQFKNNQAQEPQEKAEHINPLSNQDWKALASLPLRKNEWNLSDGLKIPASDRSQEYYWGQWNFQDLINEGQKKDVITSLKKQINEMVVLEKMKEKADELHVERKDRPWEKIDGWKWIQFVQTERQGVATTLLRNTHQVQDITSINEILKKAYEKGINPINQWNLRQKDKDKIVTINRQFDDYAYDEIITSYVWKTQQQRWTSSEKKAAYEQLDKAFGVTLSKRWNEEFKQHGVGLPPLPPLKISKIHDFRKISRMEESSPEHKSKRILK